MKRLVTYNQNDEIPSNATFLTSYQSNDERCFVYEIPIVLDAKKDKKKESDVNETIQRAITYLNNKTGSKYTLKSKAHNSKIRARINEGATPEDFKAVIDRKCSEWLDDPKWSQFLRPETLFSSKFWGYLSSKTAGEMSNDAFEELEGFLK